MAVVLLNQQNLSHYADRIRAIAPDAQPLFGKLSLARMLRHVRYLTEVSLEEIKVEDRSNIIIRGIVRPLFFHVFTNWPKGKFKAPPQYFPEEVDSVDSEKDKLVEALERFVKAQDSDPERVTVSEFFGPVSLTYWGRIQGVHMNHHLKQFSV